MSQIAQPSSKLNINQCDRPLTIRQRILQLRELFENSGFHEQPVTGGLRYIGQINGRRVTLCVGARGKTKYFTPSISRRVYTDVVMSIEMETKIRTRLLLFEQSESSSSWLVAFLQKRQGNTCLENLNSAYPGIRIWASEPDWADSFLRLPQVREPLDSLLLSASEQRNVIHWSPGRCNFSPTPIPRNLSPKILAQWLAQLESVASAAEANPPQQSVQLNWLERQQQKGNLSLIILLFLFAVTFVFVCIVGIPIVTIAILLTIFG